MGYSRSILFKNNGNGTFTDVTKEAGVALEGEWPASAGFLDYDRDGNLDLAVANYIHWDYKSNVWCGEKREGYRSYCHPDNHKGRKTVLLHNNGNGTFSDVSEESGVGVPESKGHGCRHVRRQ